MQRSNVVSPAPSATAGRGRRALFYGLAGAFVFGAAMHVRALADHAVDPSSPAWRHGLFVGINLVAAIGFVWRPWFFLPALLVLAVQQGSTHGVAAVDAATRGAIAWADWAVVATFLVAIAALVWDLLTRRRPPEA